MMHEIRGPVEYDIEFTLKGVRFELTETIIRDFLKQYRSESRPEWEQREGNVQIIPANGYWNSRSGTFLKYINFILDHDGKKFSLGIRKPALSITLEDCIKSRDNFSEGFIDYLISKGWDII